MTGVYLLHFDPRYEHAGHYLGFAEDIERRVKEHVTSSRRSSPLVRAAIAAGCDVGLVRTWPSADRNFERRLKNQGGLSRHCPVCRMTGHYHA